MSRTTGSLSPAHPHRKSARCWMRDPWGAGMLGCRSEAQALSPTQSLSGSTALSSPPKSEAEGSKPALLNPEPPVPPSPPATTNPWERQAPAWLPFAGSGTRPGGRLSPFPIYPCLPPFASCDCGPSFPLFPFQTFPMPRRPYFPSAFISKSRCGDCPHPAPHALHRSLRDLKFQPPQTSLPR